MLRLDIQTDSPVLVALSGGADSVSLFHLTAMLCRERGHFFYACHVNHGIRGDEAIRDRDFCVALADSCPECKDIFVLDADVPSLAKESGKSLETEARDLRYRFFDQIMTERGISLLLTAHNADDNLETLIFNLVRGTGPRGMRGIPPERPLGDGKKVIRPLLPFSKSEILDFCRDNGFEFVTDSTNNDTDYSRNLIRREVIPLLEKINPALRRSASRLSDSMRQLCSLAETDCAFDGSGLPLDTINSAHPATLPYILSQGFEGEMPELEAVHINALAELCKKAVEGSCVSLPSKTRGVIRDGRLIFEADTRKKKVYEDYELELTEGENILPDGSSILFLTGDKAKQIDLNIYKFTTKAKLNFDTTSITAKNRRAGDKIIQKGTRRELRKIFSEAKLPEQVRSTAPVISINGENVCVPGIAASDRIFTKTEYNAVFVWVR